MSVGKERYGEEMDGLIAGVDLCDAYTQVNCAGEEKVWTIPTVLCRSREEDLWYVGEDAYAHNLKGDGIIVDKLVKLALRGGTATLAGVRYEAADLLREFLKHVLELPGQEYGRLDFRQIVFTVRHLDTRLIGILRGCMAGLQIPPERISVISHPESFIYYTLSQKKEIWNNTVGMFDLSEECLRYYEMKVQRALKRTTVVAEYEEMEEGFNLDILDSPSGAKLADRILCSCADRMTAKKLYSAMILSGKGFEERGWAEGFMKQICFNRRVYTEQALFARGAAARAQDILVDKNSPEKNGSPFICICEGRLKATVSMNVLHRGQETNVVLAAAGDSWYERRAVVDVIPEAQETIDFVITPVDSKKKRIVTIPLEGFPRRPEKTTRVNIQIAFLDGRTMDVRLKDEGFGELFPASDAQIRQEVML